MPVWNDKCILSHAPGLRHMSVLKLTGRTMDDMGGVLELYPVNGKTGDLQCQYLIKQMNFYSKVGHSLWNQHVSDFLYLLFGTYN